MKKHIQSIHEKSTAMDCNVCLKTFSDKSSLRTHIKDIHLKLRPNQCPVCKEYFGSNFANHLRKVHGEAQPYSCEQCPMKFKYQSTFENHVKMEH
jgi:uncharacterized Zn-finger protein